MKEYSMTSIDWLKKGVITVQEAEALVLNQRKGLATLEFNDIYTDEHSPAAAERLSELGIELVVVQAYNNIGYDADNENMKFQREMAKHYHSKGIKVGAYVQSIASVFFEGVVNEEKLVFDWVQKDYLGRVPTYYNSYFRLIPCINKEEYLNHVEKGIKYAVENLDADLVFFDNYGYYSFACTCDECKKAFRDYLGSKYSTRQEKMERFGFPTVEGIMPPVFADSMGWTFTDPFQFVSLYDPDIIVDPVQQEWIEFRCKRLGEVSKRFYDFIKNLSPHTAVVFNPPYMGPIGGLNNAVFHGVWPAEILQYCDAFAAEADQGMLGMKEDGRMSTRVRTFKYGRAFKRGIWMTNFRRQHITLDLSESMAFNPFVFNTVGLPDLKSLEPETKRYIEFFKKNRDYFTDTEIIPEVALLNSFASLSYEMIAPLMSLVYFEEVLIRSMISYCAVFDNDMDDLSKYPVLVLPNVKLMSTKQIRQIERYVREGGSLIATDQTSLLDDWGRRRKGVSLFTIPLKDQKFGLEEILGMKWPVEGIKKGTLGKGKFIIIPKIVPHASVDAEDKTSGPSIDDCFSTVSSKISYVAHSIGPKVPYLKPLFGYLPANWKEILEAIEWAGEGREVLRINTSANTAAELLVQRDTGRIMLHLVNYNHDDYAKDVKVKLRVPGDGKVNEIVFITPECEGGKTVKYHESDGVLSFDVPEFKVYCLIVLKS